MNQQITEPQTNHQTPKPIKPTRRRDLLPIWIKIFVWIFLLFLAAVPVGIIMGILRINFTMSFLGLATNEPFSTTGLVLLILFAAKGILALALWLEKTWAVRAAKIDAILSAIICIGTMVYIITGPSHSFSFRLELIVLVFYFIKMNNIQHDWENFNGMTTENLPVIEAI
jgi:hypothetical protein